MQDKTLKMISVILGSTIQQQGHVSAIAVQVLIMLLLRCSEKETLLKLGYCITYQKDNGFHVGICNSVDLNRLEIITDNYIRLPKNVSDLDDYMCGPTNGQGPVCSQCADGFGLAVFSILDIHVPTALVYGMEYLSIYSWSLYHLLFSTSLLYFSISMSPQLLWWPLSFSVRLLFHHSLPWF